VASVADLRLAPFHLLASEGAVHVDKDHVWHLETLAEVCRADPVLTLTEHLERLRARGLSAKRSLALREFALGVEALERFVRGEPLRRVHECVFGVLALESEPVDPRL